MKNLLFILLALAFSGCLKEPVCEGEASVVMYSELMQVQVLDQNNESVFNTIYNIDSLKIIENGKEFKRDTTYVTDSLQQFVLKSFSTFNVWDNFDTIITAEVILKYNYLDSDTLVFKAKPVEMQLDCFTNTEYEFIEVTFNSTLVRQKNNVTCFTCKNDPVILKL